MTADVVIAGGGPNGLMLACELSLAGVRPVVLERDPEPVEKHRANGLVGQVVRMLHRRGLYERLTAGSGPPEPAPVPVFMFGALPLDLRAVEDNPLCVIGVPQTRLEEVLTERAVELGVEIRRGHELTGLTQGADTAIAEVAGPEGAYRLPARYLVGADGGRSRVRKLAGIGFPGVTADNSTSRSAHVSLPAELRHPQSGGLDIPGYGILPPFSHKRTDRGLIAYAPFDADTPLLSTAEWDAPTDVDAGDAPLTLEELRDSARRVLGADLVIHEPQGPGPHMLRRVTGTNTRLAERYRDGRVLLVGDAAHVHSALGGPGLNLGLQDAVNLGWKLAAEVRGGAAPGLLDTYETERRPAAERVNMQTQTQAALSGPGSDVTALRSLFAELLENPENTRHIAATMAGSDLRYDMGGGSDGGPDGERYPVVGRWAPDLVLRTDGGEVPLAELTRDARPLLLDLTADGSLAREAAGDDRVRAVAARPVDAPAPAAALLLRPDGYVAWACDTESPDEDQRAALRAALARWFGPVGAASPVGAPG